VIVAESVADFCGGKTSALHTGLWSGSDLWVVHAADEVVLQAPDCDLAAHCKHEGESSSVNAIVHHQNVLTLRAPRSCSDADATPALRSSNSRRMLQIRNLTCQL